jgi:two-component system, sensor histidine kinase and response regulator
MGEDRPVFEGSSLLRLVLDAIGEGILIADETGKFVFFNRTAEQMLGVGLRESMHGELKEAFESFFPDGRTPFPSDEHPLARALRGEETNHVEQLVRTARSPGSTHVAMTSRPMRDATGRITGALVLLRDVTPLRRAQRDLERANAELVDLQRRQAELSSLIVHDLKSPLTTIIGTTEVMLEDEQASAREREDLRSIQQAARSMHRMAMDLLDVAMSEDGVLLPRLETIDVGSLVSAVRRAMSFRATERNQEIQISLRELAVPTWVLDEELMRRVLQNLVDNCIKYGPAGGTIDIEAATVENRLVISVRDRGSGVPEAMREKIFEKYARIERDGSGRHRESRGLGLRFCRIAVEAHGGRIWVEDNRPGAIFRVELPTSTPLD